MAFNIELEEGMISEIEFPFGFHATPLHIWRT